MSKKTIDFRTSISDVKVIDPSFSACKIRILYTGRNRNMSIIEREAVENALPTLLNKPIIGEFSTEKNDWKGHGGAIDMDSYDFIHTTKPYGIVPESATFEWETVGGREYLTVHGCLLWTGRYSEANSVIEKAKGQSMEIEVTSGEWVDEEEAYRIDSFVFSALCILGDDVSPAFEDASISSYSLKNPTFQAEFAELLSDLEKTSYSKEGKGMEKLKEMLEKYSTTVEELTAKGLVFEEISEDELEAKIAEALNVEVISEEGDAPDNQEGDQTGDGANADPDNGAQSSDGDGADDKEGADAQGDGSQENGNKDADNSVDVEALEARILELEGQVETRDLELNSLREFKLNVENEKALQAKTAHAEKAQELFSNFQLKEEDIKDLDVHAFSIEEIEEKCYAILGRKLAQKKNFSKDNGGGLRLPLVGNEENNDDKKLPWGGLVEQYKNKK